MQNQEEFSRAAEILQWNKRLMSTLGLWPDRRNNYRFYLNFGYFTIFMILEYLDLFLFINNLEHVVMNLTENMAFSQIFVRMSMLRLHNDQLGQVIRDATKDYDFNLYKNSEERKAFLTYVARSKIFVKLLMAFVALTASSYYLTPILIQLGSGLPQISISENESRVLYILPYRFHMFHPVEDTQTYVLTYAIQLPFVFVSGFGQSAADCIMVTLVFHICGQLSTLALRINSIGTDPTNCHKELCNVVKTHVKLLRMGKVIEEAFNVTLLAHLFGATSLVCILGYQILTFLVLLILYAHCTVGESLLTESAKVCAAFYDCKWYEMPVESARCVVLCMIRAQKPLCLTAGKFAMFSLSTLTDVLRTSMGYLSVLRSFLH